VAKSLALVGQEGGWDSIYENDQSDKVLDTRKAAALWEYATAVTGVTWPEANQPKSPCPTLKVVGLATSFLERREEQKRMAVRPGIDGAFASTKTEPAMFDRQIQMIKDLQTKLLGDVPEEAVAGSNMFDVGVASVKKPASA